MKLIQNSLKKVPTLPRYSKTVKLTAKELITLCESNGDYNDSKQTTDAKNLGLPKLNASSYTLYSTLHKLATELGLPHSLTSTTQLPKGTIDMKFTPDEILSLYVNIKGQQGRTAFDKSVYELEGLEKMFGQYVL